MPRISPFSPLAYRDGIDPAAVLAPPYDLISESQRDILARRSPHNVVRLILPESPAHAAALLEAWLRERVLVGSDRPAFYWCRQEYERDGKTMTGAGLFALLRMEELGRGAIRPHEEINKAVSVEQLKLLRATRANFSPIMVLHRDETLFIEKNIGRLSVSREPDLEYTDDDQVRFSLWKLLPDPGITGIFSSREVFIADGHHRYTSAWRYHCEAGTEASGFIMCYFLNAAAGESPVLSFHRYFPRAGDREMKIIRERFDLEPAPDVRTLAAALSPGRIGIGSGRHFFFADLPGSAGRESLFLHRDITRGLLGLDDGDAGYEKEATDTARLLREKGGLAFFLPPLTLGMLEAVWREGVMLPRKSTLFYPKIPSGLLIYHHGERPVRPGERNNG